MDIVKMPLLALTVVAIGAIGIYFGVPLMIPPFAASLFSIFIGEDSEFSHFKNVVGGHLIGFGCGLIGPWIIFYLPGWLIPENFISITSLGVAILIAGWIMAITRFEHPPGIATTLIFFNIDMSRDMFMGFIPLNSLISFSIGLVIVGVIAFIAYKKE